MTDVLNAVIGGAPIGCVFALLAVGLVLTYRTAGVFNLAFGAQAFVSAAVYYDTRVRHEWPDLGRVHPGAFVVAPLLGYLLDRALFRHLRTARSIAKLVTTLGLLVAIPEITKLWFGSGASFGVKGIWPTTDEIGGPTIYRWGDYAVDGNQVATVLVTLVAVAALTAMFRWSQLGLRMRATVESPRMTELAGINADRMQHLRLDAVQPLRRPRRGAAGPAVLAGQQRELPLPAHRGYGRRRLRQPAVHPHHPARGHRPRHRLPAPLHLAPGGQHPLPGAAPGPARSAPSSCSCCSGPASATGGRPPTRSPGSTHPRRPRPPPCAPGR